MRQFFVLFLIIFSFSHFSLFGQDLLYKTLKSNLSVRAIGMGQAFTGIAEGGAGFIYNPAGAAVPGSIIQFENLDNSSINSEKFSAQFLYLSPFVYGQWENRISSLNSVSVHSYTFAYQGQYGIDWGVTYKNIQENTVSRNSNGWSSDLGLMFRLLPNLNLGFMFQDIIKHNVETPTTIRSGVAWRPFEWDFTIAGDAIYNSDNNGTAQTHFGLESLVSDGLILRAGIYDKTFTTGASILLPIGSLDYGIVIKKNDPENNIYSLSWNLGRQVPRKDQKRRYSLFKPHAYAEFALSGSLVEGKSEISLLGGQKIGANDLITLIHMATEDPSSKGFIIRIGSVSSSLASVGLIQEIRHELQKAKNKGKHIIAYIENWATLPEYYLASVADEIMMPELGTISHLGLEIEIRKTNMFLNNFGIDTDVMTSGKYKGALNPNTDEIDEEQRSILQDLLMNLYNQVLFDIKEVRKLNWDAVNEVFDGRLISASKAKEIGLIDHLNYWENMEDEFNFKEAKTSEDIKRYPLTAFADPIQAPSLFSPFNRIAIIEIDGAIHGGTGGTNFLFGGKSTGAEEILKYIKSIKKDHGIKGVILRINSPGGTLIGADRIYSAIKDLKKSGKVIYASMGNVAASGGYYIALAADKIIANRGTLTGSIGVISSFTNYEGLNDLLGIETDSLKTGEYMDMLSSTRKLTEKERELLQVFQDEQYKVFVNKVLENRKIDKEEIKSIAQGQVFTGSQALELNLIDKIGSFYDVVDELSKETKIKKPELIFYRQRPSRFFSFLSQIFN